MKITGPELAAALGVSVRTLRRWVRSGLVERPSLGRSWSAEGACVVARARRVAPPAEWVAALTDEQRSLIGWAA